jgi:hypothetical protein
MLGTPPVIHEEQTFAVDANGEILIFGGVGPGTAGAPIMIHAVYVTNRNSRGDAQAGRILFQQGDGTGTVIDAASLFLVAGDSTLIWDFPCLASNGFSVISAGTGFGDNTNVDVTVIYQHVL